MTATCVICTTEFVPSRNSTGKYCGRRCAWLARGGAGFNARVARESAQKRGDTQRGNGQGVSYRKLNGRHEHRVVAERAIGRSLVPGEVVHHIDGDILNNTPENLKVMTQAEHMRQHGLGVPGVAPAWKPWETRRAA